MKKLAVLTGTRADFGLLAPIIKKLRTFPDLDVRLAVTGAHLSPEFGLTVSEIEAEGIPVDRKIEILLSSYRKSRQPSMWRRTSHKQFLF